MPWSARLRLWRGTRRTADCRRACSGGRTAGFQQWFVLMSRWRRLARSAGTSRPGRCPRSPQATTVPPPRADAHGLDVRGHQRVRLPVRQAAGALRHAGRRTSPRSTRRDAAGRARPGGGGETGEPVVTAADHPSGHAEGTAQGESPASRRTAPPARADHDVHRPTDSPLPEPDRARGRDRPRPVRHARTLQSLTRSRRERGDVAGA